MRDEDTCVDRTKSRSTLPPKPALAVISSLVPLGGGTTSKLLVGPPGVQVSVGIGAETVVAWMCDR